MKLLHGDPKDKIMINKVICEGHRLATKVLYIALIPAADASLVEHPSYERKTKLGLWFPAIDNWRSSVSSDPEASAKARRSITNITLLLYVLLEP